MNRPLLTMAVLCSSLLAQAQVITFVQEPASVSGDVQFTWADPPDWGTADLNDPQNAITDTLALALDANTADSLVCDPVVNDVNGKIAVLWRGDCEFGVKALNAENAGAVGVVIINHSGAPVPMGAGAQGINVTIPVIMVSTQAGEALSAAIRGDSAVVAFIGNKQNLFSNDVGMYPQHVWMPESSAKPALLAADASELNVNLGSWVTNYGSDPQTDVTLSASVDQGATNLYAQTSVPVAMINSGDSAFISLPDFNQPSYSGLYDITYTVASAAVEEYPGDNEFKTNMLVDDLFTYARIDPVTELPQPDQFVQVAMQTLGFAACNHFRDANASRAAVTGIYAAASTAADDSLPGQIIEATVYRWDDTFVDLSTTPTFDFVTPLGSGEYIYTTDQQREMVYMELTDPVILEDNVRYLFCAETLDDRIFIGHTGTIDYMLNQDSILQPIGVLNDIGANSWNGVGFGTDAIAAVGAVMAANDVSVNEVSELSTSPAYPNPAKSEINIPLKDVNSNGSLQIMNMEGRVVSTKPVQFNGGMLTVDVSDLANGAYVFQLEKKDGARQSFNVVVNK